MNASACNGEASDHSIDIKQVKQKLDSVADSFTIDKNLYNMEESVTEDTLRKAAEMYVYLSFCPPKLDYGQVSQLYTQNGLLLIFSRILKSEQGLPFKKDLAGILKNIRVAWNPNLEDIEKLLGKIPSHDEVRTELLHDQMLQKFRYQSKN